MTGTESGAYALLRQQAEDIMFTQCDGCTACQQRAKAVARAYLALIGVTDALEHRAAPTCRHCDESLMLSVVGEYWTHVHGLYRCQQKVTYGHNAAHPDVPCESLGPINQCACLR